MYKPNHRSGVSLCGASGRPRRHCKPRRPRLPVARSPPAHPGVVTRYLTAVWPESFDFTECWVPGGSLAGPFARHHLALKLACGADFSCKFGVPGGSRRSRGFPGVGSGRKRRENQAEDIRPDCLQVPRSGPARLHRGALQDFTEGLQDKPVDPEVPGSGCGRIAAENRPKL